GGGWRGPVRRHHRPGRRHRRASDRRRRRGSPRPRQYLPACRLELQGPRATGRRDHRRGRGDRGARGQADHEAADYGDHVRRNGRCRRRGARLDRALVTGEETLSAAAPRTLTLLAVALVCSMATWFSASAVVPQLRDDWGLSKNAAAWLTIAVQLGFVAGALVSSLFNVADVVAPHLVVFAGSAGAATANLLLLAVHGPEGAIPLRFVTGFFLAGVYPPALKLMP